MTTWGRQSFHTPLSAGRTKLNPASPFVIDRPDGMDGWILNLTVRGLGRFGRGDGERRTEPGDLVLLPPEAPHLYTFDPERGDWVHLWVYFFPRPDWLDWLHWPAWPEGLLHLTAPPGAPRRRIRRRFEDLIAHGRGPLQRRVAFAMNALEEILLACDLFNPRSADARLDDRIRTALDLLHLRYAEPLTVADLAETCGLSPSRFSHLFRREVGTPPMRYLEERRMERAGELLAFTGKPVAEVARTTGYADPLYFSQVFRRNAGCSPRAYRNRASSDRTR